MHNLLSKLFEKKGISNTKELTEDERTTFDRWEKVLSVDEITVQKIADFCKAQQKIIETGWKDLSAEKLKNERSVIIHSIYGTLLDLINGPKSERESLERYLNSLLTE